MANQELFMEIKNPISFLSYLSSLGVKRPLENGNWEFMHSGHVLAKIVVDKTGHHRYYVPVSRIRDNFKADECTGVLSA